jgi:hypothetical protein
MLQPMRTANAARGAKVSQLPSTASLSKRYYRHTSATDAAVRPKTDQGRTLACIGFLGKPLN